MSDDLVNALRRIAKVSYGATIEEARSVSKTQRDAADLIEQQAARIAELQDAIRKQANAARSLADATIRDASIRQELAEKARAESSPEVLASERQANAMLTEENERLTARIAALESQIAALTGKVDGWKLVPVEPTETMVVCGFESWPDEFFSEPEEWAAYEAMTGCQQAAHKARLCYAAMLAAAPTVPVAPAVDAQPIAWESTTPVYRRFITDTRYQMLRPEARKWYKPYRCPHCASAQSEGLRKALTEIAEQEHIELMLDPTWAQRIAIAALSQHTGETK